jgi:hypothetical protein
VINKRISGIVADEKYSQRLRVRSMLFLKKLMRSDTSLTPLILSEINLEQFMEVNVFGKDQQMIARSEELLQCF